MCPTRTDTAAKSVARHVRVVKFLRRVAVRALPSNSQA
jgi:hypothetical protein